MVDTERGRGLLRLAHKAKRLMQGSKRTNAVTGQNDHDPISLHIRSLGGRGLTANVTWR